MKLAILSLVVLLSLTACQTAEVKIPQLAAAENVGTSVVCTDDCQLEWERAQIWLARHAITKIQLANNTLLQTYNPVYIRLGDKIGYGFSVTKEPMEGGMHKIEIAMACNFLSCSPSKRQVSNAFYYYLKTGKDLLRGLNLAGVN